MSLLSPSNALGHREDLKEEGCTDRLGVRGMILPEEEHAVLKDRLYRNLKRKHALELEISRQYEKLKKLEISIEKRAIVPASEERRTTLRCFS